MVTKSATSLIELWATVGVCKCACVRVCASVFEVSSATAWSEKLPQTLLFCFPIFSH